MATRKTKVVWSRIAEFLMDARGDFNIFTVVSLAAASALIYIAIEEVRQKGVVQLPILYALFCMYLFAVASDGILAMVISRGEWKSGAAPDTVVNAQVDTEAVNVTP